MPLAWIRTDRPYVNSEVAIAIAWIVGFAVSLALCPGGLMASGGVIAVSRDLVAAVGLGSGLVAMIGGLPGVAMDLLSRSPEAASRATIGFSAGVVIRLLGTVALMAVCSYHFPAAKTEVAGTTLAWYVYLLTVDVAALAVFLPRQNKSAVTRRSCLAEQTNQ